MKIPLGIPVLALALLVSACQSPPPAVEPVSEVAALAVPEVPVVEVPLAEVPLVRVPSRVETSQDGFSPLAQAPANEFFFDFRWGEASQIATWELRIGNAEGTVFRTVTGQDTEPGLAWNGRDDKGDLVPQGAYTAVLSWTDREGMVSESAPTPSFWVDIVPPSGRITVSPPLFRLVEPHVIVSPSSEVTIALEVVSGGSGWATWRLNVLHPDGRLFRDFISENHRDNTIVWDGRAVNNAQLEAGTTYQLSAEIYSRYGNKGRLFAGLAVAHPIAVAEAVPAPAEVRPLEVSVTLDGEVLAALPVWFGPNTADLSDVDSELNAVNQSSLAQLADLLRQAPGTEVTVVGHANQVLYFDPQKAAYEQSETLLPLSLSRAQAVKDSLVGLGLDGSELATEGVGALQPLAAFDDAGERWKNRRVVIELVSQ